MRTSYHRGAPPETPNRTPHGLPPVHPSGNAMRQSQKPQSLTVAEATLLTLPTRTRAAIQ